MICFKHCTRYYSERVPFDVPVADQIPAAFRKPMTVAPLRPALQSLYNLSFPYIQVRHVVIQLQLMVNGGGVVWHYKKEEKKCTIKKEMDSSIPSSHLSHIMLLIIDVHLPSTEN